ncbi:chemotaxis protein MotA [Clostridium tetanomorphum]|uniref:motility protein A n=1 Tax=Clostridium tetanomorphum TaxID=1553 RepID=UPI0004516490|nr:motility protein A [Clostridium tetanomorphum]KAJ49919.1 chemotaxis MotA protein [Clostridium tetanomorphum DSM 665]MBP1866143.1 chemotaxis protein MotA [Clostridium tetanomorphum]NRS85122.1 chemotaxis protein MotA [Clostridium tetanomorphum]SQC03174.1 chemotaxis protein MotA [Clostridium tetanomorphum]
MKRRDVLTAIGIGLGFGMMIWSMAMVSITKYNFKQLKLFWDLSSVIITLGGSLCAMLVNYPINQFKKLIKITIESFKESEKSSIDIINQFIELSRKARREGLLSLEDEINQVNDGFLKKGLQMVVDGMEPETIKDIMELEISEMERRHKDGADMLRAWGGYAPAFGMAGTLIGLIQMLGNLSDSSQIASGMGKALITTFYGSLIANILFNPMASNLSFKSAQETAIREMMLEGILAIQSGVNPRIVEEKLISYLSPDDRKTFAATATSEGGVSENG